MREGLGEYKRERLCFIGTVQGFGKEKSGTGKIRRSTILVKNIHLAETKESLADHAWLLCGKWSNGLKTGNVIMFEARVTRYQKANEGAPQEDYTLNKPKLIRVLRDKPKRRPNEPKAL